MSQYYPQQGPYYLPEQGPEDDYYEEGEYDYEDEEENGSQSPLFKYGVPCLVVGCLIFLCLGCCGIMAVGFYALDPTSLLAPTPIPGSDLGLNFDEAANPDEAVVNDQQTRLAILDVNRNAALENMPPIEGRELIIVTVEVVNIGNEEIKFNERDFLLLNQDEEAYEPLTGGVIDGVLGRGTLPPGEGLEGRLVFQIRAGEADLVLAWEGEGGSRYIYLE